MPKLTKRIVDTADPQEREYFIWDSDIPGLGLRILPRGRKSYVVQYRAGRRSRRITLGPNTVLTCTQARNRAIEIIAAARNGEDPAAARDAQRTAVTVRELAERFDAEHIAIRLKPSTVREYRRNLRRFILPALGRLLVTEVTRADVAKFHHDLRHIPYQANRCLEVISKMFNLAEMWGLRSDGTNPRKHIRKYPEETVRRLRGLELACKKAAYEPGNPHNGNKRRRIVRGPGSLPVTPNIGAYIWAGSTALPVCADRIAASANTSAASPSLPSGIVASMPFTILAKAAISAA